MSGSSGNKAQTFGLGDYFIYLSLPQGKKLNSLVIWCVGKLQSVNIYKCKDSGYFGRRNEIAM